jgi:hypothetical protein
VVKASQGPRHPRSTNTLHHLGIVLQLDGRYREAEAVFREALAIQLDMGRRPRPSWRHGTLTSAMPRPQHRIPERLSSCSRQQSHRTDEGATDRWRPLILAQLSGHSSRPAIRARRQARRALSSPQGVSTGPPAGRASVCTGACQPRAQTS